MIGSIRLVLFDLGNTLFFDNARAWPRVYARAEAALWRVLHRAGLKVAAAELYGKPDTLLGYYYALRGSGIDEPTTFRVLSGLLERQGVSLPTATVASALRAMYAATQTNWRVERDAAPTLRTLARRGFKLGAISNVSDDQNAHELLAKARLRPYFEMVLTSAAHGRRKPDASIFTAALGHFGVDPQQAVMIGDDYKADVVGADALGMRTIWITRRNPQPLVRGDVVPDAEVTSLTEVPALLE